ncbi:RNA polymerase, sigma-24 subunit, ECF subfamily [Fibrisoma limi BUZ 3]|uniref:RNA polymerase, sigma-24 subunit, ECF subfamily n=1 Tax=Fibrisoma limi BUZ 3 TaxID=1185876 RepID=I2GJS3_9BACT|nr:sigma-70 family RNA polymerase sigma factor [Fibrisoma limi]CCH54148.1 RNA polymerase, sigma-24 subunit, ECF subfamily [Fibrisoma limi BUZ 3]
MAIRPLPTFLSDQELYDALKRRDDRAYQYLYAESFPSFRHWMLTHNGSEMDAEDAFQKGMLSFLLNVETGKYQFQASTQVTTVLFEYCKRVWLTELKSARVRTKAAMPDSVDSMDTGNVVEDLERLEVVNTVQKSLSQLKDECRKLIEWFYIEELSLREIAERLGMKETSVKSKRYDCAEKLKGFYAQNAKKMGL